MKGTSLRSRNSAGIGHSHQKLAQTVLLVESQRFLRSTILTKVTQKEFFISQYSVTAISRDEYKHFPLAQAHFQFSFKDAA